MSVFFFQAEDGIRDIGVTGVQTCALPIFLQSHGQPLWHSFWRLPLPPFQARAHRRHYPCGYRTESFGQSFIAIDCEAALGTPFPTYDLKAIDVHQEI